MTDKERRAKALERLIKAECKLNPSVKTIRGLAVKMGIGYRQVYEPLHRGTISALMMNDILHALNANPETVARFIKIQEDIMKAISFMLMLVGACLIESPIGFLLVGAALVAGWRG